MSEKRNQDGVREETSRAKDEEEGHGLELEGRVW